METINSNLINGIYELARVFYESGYPVPAEKLFSGLAAIDGAQTPARIGLGLVKLENGLFGEASAVFRQVLDSGFYPLQGKLGLAISYVASSDLSRARSLLAQIEKEHRKDLDLDPYLLRLWEALFLRCSGSLGSLE